jgi:signal transduction histidine kinase
MSWPKAQPAALATSSLETKAEAARARADASPQWAARWRWLGRVVAVAGSYLLAGELTIQISFHHITGVSVWPPTGLGVAVLLIWGRHLWPGILLGEFCLDALAGQSPGVALWLAAVYTVEALAGAHLASRWDGGSGFFRSPLSVIKFSGAMVLASLLGASLEGVGWLIGLGQCPGAWGRAWLASGLGEMLSLLVGTPLVLSWCLRPPEGLSRGGAPEFALVLLMLSLVSGAVFGSLMPLPTVGFLHSYVFLPLLIWVAFRFGPREMATAAFLLGVVALWGTLHGQGLFNRTAPDKALYVCQVFIVLNAVAGLTVAALVTQRARAVAELTATNVVLQEEIEQRRRAVEAHQEVQRRLAEAAETERSRISRELHDQFGQDLTALKLGLQMVRKRDILDPAARECVGQLEQLSDELMRHTHRLAWQLRPTALDDFGLEMALRRYGEDWSRLSGVPVDFHSLGLETGRLPTEVETALYRAAQEALTNVLRHARARRVSVLLERKSDLATLIVEDDGIGFIPETASTGGGDRSKLGLLGMRERLLLAGGSLTIESAPGAGATVFARIPLTPPSTPHPTV